MYKYESLYYKSRDREFVFTLQVDIDHLNYHHIEESRGHHDEHQLVFIRFLRRSLLSPAR